MKFGPVTFQCTCLRVRARSLSEFSRSCSSLMTRSALSFFIPGTVYVTMRCTFLLPVICGKAPPYHPGARFNHAAPSWTSMLSDPSRARECSQVWPGQ